MKSYTDIEQSKVLAKILPLESADMVYIKHSSSNNPEWRFDNDIPPMVLSKTPINKLTTNALPCWSLATLISVLPSTTLDKLNSSDNYYYRLLCMGRFTEWCDNPIDACYEMIVKLHELNLL